VGEGLILAALEEQRHEILGLLGSLDAEAADFRYAPGKWSVKEVVGHLLDSERIFATRALCLARGEAQALPGFEQDDYVRRGDFDHRSLLSLVREFEAVRLATEALFENLSEEQWTRSGVANAARISVRAIAYIVVGHAAHHTAVIRERYLSH
jgi:uncharacterized damage-inducible protein DinB